jgi:hypothetical protein
MLNACVTLALAESVTWTVKVLVPRVVGVPVISAESLLLDDEKVRPGGRLPEIKDHVNGGGAPAAVINVS